MSFDWNLILEKSARAQGILQGPADPVGAPLPRGSSGAGHTHGPCLGPSASLLSFQPETLSLVVSTAQSRLPAIVLGSLSVILGPLLRKEQTAQKPRIVKKCL